MEFKFRAVDDRPPPYLPPPTTVSYFSEHALRANYFTAPNFMRNPRDVYSIHREIEKEKIRQEIIAEENMRRRVLEEEVRRELMMERKMAMCRESEMGLPIEERLTMQLDSSFPKIHQFDNNWLEDRLAFPRNNGLGLGHEALPPFFPLLSDVTDNNRTSLEAKKNDKVIILAKPQPSLSGIKRKATTPPAGAGKLPFVSSEKKPAEWSCALCRVSATSERGLNEHLQGKKHKAKEAALRAEKLQNNSTASLSKKSRKRIKLVEARGTAETEVEMKVGAESLQTNKTEDGSERRMGDGEDLKSENVLPKQEKGKKIGIWTLEEKEKTPEYRKKFKFWCEICHIGAYSEGVMENHKKGKKHMARLQKLNQNDEAASGATTTTTSITTTTMVASAEPPTSTTMVASAEPPAATTMVASAEPSTTTMVASAEPTTTTMITSLEPNEIAKDADVDQMVAEETTESVTGDSVAQVRL